jgi:hypothetical protein
MVTYESLIGVQIADIEFFRKCLLTSAGSQYPLAGSFKRRIADAEKCVRMIRQAQDRKALRAL